MLNILLATQFQRYEIWENRKKNSIYIFFTQKIVHDYIFPRLVAKKISKEEWDLLQQAYQGTHKVKVVKFQSLRRNFEALSMQN
jgi:hypothetical protein